MSAPSLGGIGVGGAVALLLPPGRPPRLSGELRAHDEQLDVVLCPQLPDVGTMREVAARLHPAGALVVAFRAGEQVDALRALQSAGLTVEQVLCDPDGTGGARARRPAGADEVARALAVAAPAAADLIVVLDGDIDPVVRAAWRLSLPPAVQVDVRPRSALHDFPDDQLVLLADAALLPQPAWVQTLWDHSRATGEPACVAVISATGLLEHAGSDVAGTLFGVGARAAARQPFLSVDRWSGPVDGPVLARAASLRTGLAGGCRFLGAARAPRARAVDAPTTPAAPLAAVYPHSALLVADTAQLHDGGERDAVLRLIEECLAAGTTPVVHVTGGGWLACSAGRWMLERHGAVVVDDTPVDGLAADPLVRTGQLAAVLQPRAVVLLSAARFAEHRRRAVYGSPRTQLIAALSDRPRGQRVDAAAGLTDAALPRQLRAALSLAPRVAEAQIAAVARRQRVAGLVSIVIPVWNMWSLTAACLDAIARCTPEPHEVIVVDNGSVDETPAQLRRRGVTTLRNSRNLGFAAGCNQGIAAASGEYVCVLNNDTQVTDGWLSELLTALQTPSAGLVGPRSNRIPGLQAVPGAPALDDAGVHDWATSWRRGRSGRSWPTTRLIGFCLLARGELFERLGGFDEGVGIGNYEDDDLCWRVQRTGLGLRVADGALVLHHGSATFMGMSVDFAATLQDGARQVLSREGRTAPAVTALVLADCGGQAAAGTAESARLLADEVLVLERGDLVETGLSCAGLPVDSVTVVGTDWADDAAMRRLLATLSSDLVLVLAAGERLEVDDWGAARAELDRLAPRPVALDVAGGRELRVHPPTAEALSAIGLPAGVALAGVRVRGGVG